MPGSGSGERGVHNNKVCGLRGTLSSAGMQRGAERGHAIDQARGSWLASALILSNVFGVGFFFLVNALHYASFCDMTSNGAAFGIILLGVVIAGGLDLAADELFRMFCKSLVTELSLEFVQFLHMLQKVLPLVAQVVFSVHMVMASLDSSYTVMITLCIAGMIFSLRYDTDQPLVGGFIAFLAMVIFAVMDSITQSATPHMSHKLKCHKGNAFVAVLAGGMWIMHVQFFIMSFLRQIRVNLLWPVYVIGALFVLGMPCLQSFSARRIWAPMLFPASQYDMLGLKSENVSYRIVIIIAQNVSVIASCFPVLLIVIHSIGMVHWQDRVNTSATGESYILLVVIAMIWATVLLGVSFESLAWVYVSVCIATGLGFSLGVGLVWAWYQPKAYWNARVSADTDNSGVVSDDDGTSADSLTDESGLSNVTSRELSPVTDRTAPRTQPLTHRAGVSHTGGVKQRLQGSSFANQGSPAVAHVLNQISPEMLMQHLGREQARRLSRSCTPTELLSM